ncbi:MAG: caspase domain-containing protein [Acidobacteriota bacterium]
MKTNFRLHALSAPAGFVTLTLILLVAGLLLVLPGSASAQQEPNRQLVQGPSSNPGASKRIALVIGNGAYTSAPPLRNPPNDARDMAATLRALGFDVTNGTNVNQREMKRLIREFGQKLRAGGSGLFYYAGHGVQSKGRNYLIPVDADIQSEVEAEDAGVDVSLVLGHMDEAQNGLNIVILDACRNNPFARSFRSASDGLAQVDAPTGTLIAYATAPGRVASDGAGQNGLYTSELLKQMQVPGLTATEMFMRVRAEVMKQTGNKQVPWEASSLVGAFYFSGAPGNSDASNRSESKVDAAAFELSYWETIKNSASADDFKAYLERYPQGQFAELAKSRIATLQPATKPTETLTRATGGGATELAFWDSIRNSTSADDYRAYLEKYPNGEFVSLAKRRLAPLETAEKEKEKQEQAKREADAEYARTHKSFKGRMGRGEDTGNNYWPATLLVSPSQISLFATIEWLKSKPCSSFKKAIVEGDYIREIDAGIKVRFRAASPAEAASALEAIQNACKNK